MSKAISAGSAKDALTLLQAKQQQTVLGANISILPRGVQTVPEAR